MIANLSKFVQEHPAMYPDAADFEPDGTFYSLIADQDRLYTVEPNHGRSSPSRQLAMSTK
jgi:hypothetical protein